MDGFAGDEFHGLMLIGHALQIDDEELAIDGLATLCYSHLSLGPLDKHLLHPPSTARVVDDFFELLKHITLTHPKYV